MSNRQSGGILFEEGILDAEAWDQVPVSITIADPEQSDCPLVFVNSAFEETTGYSSSEVLGRNCRFLQGPESNEKDVLAIRAAIEAGRSIEVTLLNYRKDGSKFWNELHLSPLVDGAGNVVYFVGIQRPVAAPDIEAGLHVAADLKLQEIQHRVKNHLAMIVSLIRLHSHGVPEAYQQRFTSLSQRVESLQLLYEQLTEKSSRRQIDDNGIRLNSYLEKIVRTTVELDSRTAIAVKVEAEPILASVDFATHLGMLVSELATNALQHGFKGQESGEIRLAVQRLEDGSIAIELADNGVGMATDVQWPSPNSLGGRIVKSMSKSIGARIELIHGEGTCFRLVLPGDSDAIL